MEVSRKSKTSFSHGWKDSSHAVRLGSVGFKTLAMQLFVVGFAHVAFTDSTRRLSPRVVPPINPYNPLIHLILKSSRFQLFVGLHPRQVVPHHQHTQCQRSPRPHLHRLAGGDHILRHHKVDQQIIPQFVVTVFELRCSVLRRA